MRFAKELFTLIAVLLLIFIAGAVTGIVGTLVYCGKTEPKPEILDSRPAQKLGFKTLELEDITDHEEQTGEMLIYEGSITRWDEADSGAGGMFYIDDNWREKLKKEIFNEFRRGLKVRIGPDGNPIIMFGEFNQEIRHED